MALIGWWPLDGNTEDYTVNQNHGTNSNVTWVNGKIGQAGSFNGTTSYVSANPSTIQIKAFSLWIKVSTIPSLSQVILVDSVSHIGIGFYSGNSFILTASNNVVDSQRRCDLNNFIVNQWNLIYVEYNNLIPRVFINNVETNYLSSNYWTTVGSEFNIGRRNSGNNFAGQINDVRLYDTKLSQKEINELAKAKILHYTFNKDEDIIYDSSGYKRNVILDVNTPTWVNTTNIGTGGYQFDGISKKITLNPDPLREDLPKDFTISLWTKGQIRSNEFTYILHRGISTTIGQSVIYIGTYLGNFIFSINGNWSSVITSVIQDPNLWYHLVLRYQGSTVTGFINGVSSISYNIGFSNTIVGTYTSLGDSTLSGSTRAYDGIIDDVQFYSSALTNDQILDLYRTRSKIDNAGNLYANEFVEDYEIQTGLTLRQLFEDKNIVDGVFNNNELVNNYSVTNKTHTFTRTNTAYAMVGDPISAQYTIENGDKVYGRFDLFQSDQINNYFRIWVRRAADNSDSLSLYFTNDNLLANQPYTNMSAYGQYTGTSSITRYHFLTGSGVVGANITLVGPSFFNLTKIFGSGSEPSQSQMDAFYRDYSESRSKQNGQFISKEFVEKYTETYDIGNNITLKELFEDNNLVNNGRFDTTDISSFGLQNLSLSIVDNMLLVEKGGTTAYQRVLINRNTSYVAGDVLYFRYSVLNTIDGVADPVISGAYLYDGGVVNNFTTRPTIKDQEYSSTVTALYDGGSGDIRLFGYNAPLENLPSSYNMDNIYFFNLTSLTNSGYFNTIPTKEQIDAWYLSYANRKMKIFKDNIHISGSLQEA
jgi:hypothetical protein